MTVFEKNAPTPTSMFLSSSSSVVAPRALSKRTLACRFLLFNFFTCLPEEKIRADCRAEDRHQRRPFITGMRHGRNQGIAQHLAPVGSHHKRGNRVSEKHKHKPLENVRDLVILEPNRCPRDENRERHYKPVGIDAGQHGSRICHARQVRANVNCICDQQGNDEGKQEPFWKSLLQIRGQALSRHLADACAHHLHGSQQRPCEKCGPEKFGSELRAGNGVCGDARRVVVSSPGDDPGPERLQKRSDPTRWGRRCD